MILTRAINNLKKEIDRIMNDGLKLIKSKSIHHVCQSILHEIQNKLQSQTTSSQTMKIVK